MVHISDVAKAAQVSPATVARVVNNNGYVSAEKKLRVTQAIQNLGYVPNRIASGLRRKTPYFIGHILSVSSENPFFSRIYNAVDETAERAGYHMLTALRQSSPEKEQLIIENLLGLMVDSIIFTGASSSTIETIKWIQAQGVQVVMIERPRKGILVDTVLLDSFAGASLAVDHILSYGHKKIGYIGKKHEEQDVEYQRYSGYLSSLEAHHLPTQNAWQRDVPDYSIEMGRQAAESILAKNNLPTALFITSDVIACGVLQALYAHHLRVPEDISIVSFDNTLSSATSPLLTSIDMQLDEVGANAVQLIIERKKGLRTGTKTITMSPILIDRGSVKRI